MRYHAPTDRFTLDQRSFMAVAISLRYAIKHIRQQAGLPLTPHKHDGGMGSAQHAEKALLDVAEEMGIDLGATRPGMLDVTNAG